MIPIVSLVTVEYARLHLRTSEADDFEVESKLLLATHIVMNHCKLTAIPESWVLVNADASPPIEDNDVPADISVITTDAGIVFQVPGVIQAAVLYVLGELFENRESSTSDPLSPAIVNLLAPYRDPTFA